MALFNEILTGRFSRGLQKLLAIKGEKPTPQIASEITPVLVLPEGLCEDWYLHGWNYFANRGTIGPVAANFNEFQLRNPASSNVIAVVTKILAGSQSGGEVFGLTGSQGNPADLASVGTPYALDGRTNTNSTLIPSSATVAAIANLAGGITIGQTVGASELDLIVHRHQEIPMLPGAALRLTFNTANTTSSVTIHWRERFLEEQERT
jgi:hypothetical protein